MGKSILLVDDDPLVRRIYQEGLQKQGFEVVCAEDGLKAVQMLRVSAPDLAVLDLMMPKFGGVDVLKFIRADEHLKELPVVVLSNLYMDEMAQQAAALGPQKALLKIRCTPAALAAVIREILEGIPAPADLSGLLAAPRRAPSLVRTGGKPPATVGGTPGSAVPPAGDAPAQAAAEAPAGDWEPRQLAREQLLGDPAATQGELQTLLAALKDSRNDLERELRLQNLYRRVHFISATAGLAECQAIGQLASVLEALLYSMIGKPALVTASVLHTIEHAIEVLAQVLAFGADLEPISHPRLQVLVVDDNPLASRLIVSAFRTVGFQTQAAQDPLAALELARRQNFDLLLLDVEMPRLDGLELCRQIRCLPGYAEVPVVFVTGHSDAATRQRSKDSGADDLIAKPVFPMELAVKSVCHLLQRRLTPPGPRPGSEAPPSPPD
ncbi:MAG TPA: response regulator [Verrucomicrobiota bacterium]|jgi:CheY-like chemotaxis protein|nr:response regulator [Verrucomicrobiota bacterium]HRT07878.1 response regulator [Candidatus Paceibacterota bacterium]HRT56040.1 response regulator [Candidatus Paceibacterota bacterium]